MSYIKYFFILTFSLFSLFIISCENDNNKQHNFQEPVDKVNLKIGAISHLLVPTYPTVQIPNSMVRIYPYTTPGINDDYLASRIFSFPVNIPSHRGHPLSTLMITTNMNSIAPDSIASSYDHDFETSTPYYYSVLLEDPGIWAGYTVAKRGAIYHFRSEAGGKVRIVLRSTHSGKYEMDTPSIIRGYDHLDKVTQFLYAVSEPAPQQTQPFTGAGDKIVAVSEESEGSGIILSYDLPKDGSIIIRTGISFISAEQARQNESKEIASRSFADIKNAAREDWNKALSRIKVTGGTKDEQQFFYTALYRCYERMIDITEDGHYYSAYDNKVHEIHGHDFYVDDWSWDTFRSLHPLRTILHPEQEADMINSYILMFQQSGWMPSFPTLSGDMGAMIGHHQAEIITDAWLKGIKNFDINEAYEGLRKNAMEGTMLPWREGPLTDLDKVYLEKGFFPAKKPGEKETEPEVHPFEGRQAVAVTLEHSYDDWVLSRLSASLGKSEDEKMFAKRGQNYKNVYNPENGFMSPKTADGKWVEPFDPKSPAGIGGREYFAECNAWVYTWFVPQDIGGLASLMGGRQAAIRRLDQLFDEPPGKSKWQYLGNMPDATGLTGLFTMGNEPSFHIPYLYDLLGAPWKTQKRVRQLMEAWFRDDLMGMSGDDDGGAMSSWYVFSALGFYPVCPGNPVYVIGSPEFEKAVIDLPGDKTFTLRALNVSSQNKYIQSATLNGKPLNVPWFTHNDLIHGGELDLQMGPRPDKAWGTNTRIADFYAAGIVPQ